VRPATEAVIELFLRADREGRGFLIVERAAGLVFTAGPILGNAPLNQFHNIGAAQQLFNKRLGYQPAHDSGP
jgi:hypothetical protein